MPYPLRIQKRSTIAAQGAGSPPSALQEYIDKLIKLIPAEAVAAYTAIHGLVSSAAKTSASAVEALPWLPLLGVAFVVLVRGWGTRAPNGALSTIQWGGMVIAVISFLILVLSLGQPIIWKTAPETWIGSTALIAWVFAVPYFYEGS